MPIEWSGLAPELLLALDRRSGDPLRSPDLQRPAPLLLPAHQLPSMSV